MTRFDEKHNAVTPFSPTSAAATPTTCMCCGRHATGTGLGDVQSDSRFLCELCLPLIENLRTIVKFDRYELAAVEGAGERAGAYLDRIEKTDLATLESDEWNYFLREVIEGFGAALRHAIGTDAPF